MRFDKVALMLILTFASVGGRAQTTPTPQQQVVAVYKQAYSQMRPGDTKWKIFSGTGSITPIGYGATEAQAWADAAARLASTPQH